MLKEVGRKLYKEKRLALTESERLKLNDLMLLQFQTVKIPSIETLLSYWPIEVNNEPNTHLFTEFMKYRNPELKVCYPVADFGSMVINAIAIDIDTPFEKKRLSIREPDSDNVIQPGEIDMIFVPLLAFDKKGYRIGYGQGFYDKYLADCRNDCIKAGFCYFEPIESIRDRRDFDIPLNICITPHNVYGF
jgi:5-formyltetrahydrofolate cyclo-ligase